MTSTNPVVSTVIKDYNSTQTAFLPNQVVIPLTEEAGIAYKSLVKPGDIVKEGDVIAESRNTNPVTYIHSSVPGEVVDIVPCYAPNTKQCYGIKIKFKGALSYLGKKLVEDKIDYLTSKTIQDRILENGVINNFNVNCPENLGLQLQNQEKSSCLVIRMFDEDPYRITDSLIGKFYYKEIEKAAEVLAKAIDAPGIVFVIDQKFQEKRIFDNVKLPNFRVLEMNIKKYPCGTPREIISAFKKTGLKKTSNFELKKNDLYIDASTAYDVYKSVILNMPTISHHVHFSGNCLYASTLLDIKIGTPIKDIVSQLGGFQKIPEVIIINGDLCGYATQSSYQTIEAPITKYVKSIKFLSSRKFTDSQIYSCINCGNCRFVCPKNISPDILYNTTVTFQALPESFAKSSLDCISCGLCNTVCPARLPLSQTISVLKDNVSNILKEQK